ncbi:MAG: amino acid adenylation domain-containing protein [Balneolales bacterium]|nr:amino acid adenylation domain-containing protein [Balneolales bacterium]
MMNKSMVQNILRLSPLQEGLYAHYLMRQGFDPYVLQMRYRLDGEPDTALLKKTLEIITARHDALRTIFSHKQTPEPVQIILKPVRLEFTELGPDELPAEKREDFIQHLLDEDHRRGFKLDKGPLLRFMLIRRSESEAELIMTTHHIILDGWSSGIIEGDVFRTYAALRSGKQAEAAPAPSYATYIRWLKKQQKNESIEYWKSALDSHFERTPFTKNRRKSLSESASNVFSEQFFLPEKLGQTVLLLARETGVSFSSLFRAIWTVFTKCTTGFEDFCSLNTVSGRPETLDNASEIAGLFINAVPQLHRFDGETISELARGIHERFTGSYAHHFVPLSDIQQVSGKSGELSDHLLVFENYPDMGDERKKLEEACGFRIESLGGKEATNYPLTVQVAGTKADDIEIRLFLKSEWFEEEECGIFKDKLLSIIHEICEDSLRPLDEITSQFMAAPDKPKQDLPVYSLLLSSTFTDLPIKPYLEYWLETAGFRGQIKFAPYNQVLQTLSSDTGNTVEAIVIAIRPADIIRDLPADSASVRYNATTEMLEMLEKGISEKQAQKSVFVALLPDTSSESNQSGTADRLELCRTFLKTISSQPNVTSVDLSKPLFALSELTDEVQNEKGHIPFSVAGFSYFASRLARLLTAGKRKPKKVIITDADNTLWGGVIGEDGAKGIRFEPHHIALQQFLLDSKQSGFVLAMATKNNAADLQKVWTERDDFLLKEHDFVHIAANWEPKSKNIRELAADLNLNTDSFIFIDDNPAEISEVSKNCPEVLSLLLPVSPESWEAFFELNWAFDQPAATAEDAIRTKLYQAEKIRKDAQRKSESAGEKNAFLKSLEVNTAFVNAGPEMMPRLSQLSARTNQFNLNGKRFSIAELSELSKKNSCSLLSLYVNDRFGTYGQSGLILGATRDSVFVIEAFMLSCRVLGRGVEIHCLDAISKLAEQHDCSTVQFAFTDTGRNIPISTFLSSSGCLNDNKNRISTEAITLLCQKEKAGAWDFYDAIPENHQLQVLDSVGKNADKKQHHPLKTPDSPTDARRFEWEIPDGDNELHALHAKVLSFQSLEQFEEISLMREDEGKADEAIISTARPGYEPPSNEVEKKMAGIWSALLQTSSIGRADHFFNLGGNSLTATRLASSIYKHFGVDIELITIFDNPVLSEFCRQVESLLNRKNDDSEKESIPKNEATPQQWLSQKLRDGDGVIIEKVPFTPGQLRIWRTEVLQEDRSSYNLGSTFRFAEKPDITALMSAFSQLMSRFDVLRCRIKDDAASEIPFMVLDENENENENATGFKPRPPVEIRKISDLNKDEAESFVLREAQTFLSEPVVFGGKLLWGVLIHESDDENSPVYISLRIHHLITDGWSQAIILQELGRLYREELSGKQAESDSEKPSFSGFLNYARWYDDFRKGSQYEDATNFWLKEIENAPERAEIPTDYPRKNRITEAPLRTRVELNPALKKKAEEFCAKNQLSLFMLVKASVQLFCRRYTEKENFLTGCAFSGRSFPELLDIPGFFVNTLPVNMDYHSEISLKEYLAELRKRMIEMQQRQFVSLDDIMEKSGRQSQASIVSGRHPLFDILVLHQHSDAESDDTANNLNAKPIGQEQLGSGFDLVFQLFTEDQNWYLELEYQPELYELRTAKMFCMHWAALLDYLTNSKNLLRPLRDASLQSKASFMRLKRAGRGPMANHPAECMHELMQNWAKSNPDSPAFEHADGKVLSYKELDKLSDIAAHFLLQRGLKKGDKILVKSRTVRNLIPVMLGILKAGCVYVPADADTPADRLDYILEKSSAVLAISDKTEPLQLQTKVDSVFFNDVLSAQNKLQELPEVSPSDSAYIIFTSGSTGRPKGVEITHGSFVNMIHGHTRGFNLGSSDRILSFASIAFDASLSEFFSAFLKGATLVEFDSNIKRDPARFVDAMNRRRITAVTLPPVFLASLGKPSFRFLRILLTAGEAAQKDDALHYAQNIKYVNAYGPTECSVCTSFHIVEHDYPYPAGIPIGNPIDNYQVFIVDGNHNLAPWGAIGELVVSGPGLAKGYIGQPELTQERFKELYLDEESAEPVRYYFTGDLVRWTAGGALSYIGRKDSQVKIRGYRIEPGEIEHQISAIKGVQHCCVVPFTASTGNKDLICYLVCDEGSTDSFIRTELSRKLPAYMIPARFIRLKSFKMNQNGKIDKNKLPSPESLSTGRENNEGSASPKHSNLPLRNDALKQAILQIFSGSTLQADKGFTENGGDSIKAIQLTNLLKNRGVLIRAGDIYEAKSLLGLDELIERQKEIQKADADLAKTRDLGSVEMSPVQQWFWTQVNDPEIRRTFRMEMVLETTHLPEVADIHKVLNELTRAHSIFRVSVKAEAEQGRLFYTDKASYHLIQKESTSAEQTLKILKAASADFAENTQLDKGSLARFYFITEKHNSRYILGVLLHHIICDATTLRILRDDLNELWRQMANRETPRLRVPEQSHGNYIQLINTILASDQASSIRNARKEFDKQLTIEKSTVQISNDAPASKHFIADTETTALLKRRAKANGEDLDSILLSAFADAVRESTGKDRFTIGVERQGRRLPDPEKPGFEHHFSGTGWYTAEIPLLADFTKTDAHQHFAEACQNLNSPEHDLSSLVYMSDRGNKAVKASNPFAGFNFLGNFDTTANQRESAKDHGEWSFSEEFDGAMGAKFPHVWHAVECAAVVQNGLLSINLECHFGENIDYRRQLCDSMADHLAKSLREKAQRFATEKEKPAIVMLPFVASQSGLFSNFAQYLKSFSDVITPELPGHGHRIEEAPATTFDELLLDLFLQLKPLLSGRKQSIWFGHSMGAFIAAGLFQKFTDSTTGKPSLLSQLPEPDLLIISDVAPPGGFSIPDFNRASEAEKQLYYQKMGYDLLLNGTDSNTAKHLERLISSDVQLLQTFTKPARIYFDRTFHFLHTEDTDQQTAESWKLGWERTLGGNALAGKMKGGHISWLYQNESLSKLATQLFNQLKQVIKQRSEEKAEQQAMLSS